MHTAIAETSVIAYRQARDSGEINQRQQQILAVMKPYPANYSLQELVKLTGLPVNVVSGRVNELREKAGKVVRGDARACSVTGKTIRPHGLPHPQRALF